MKMLNELHRRAIAPVRGLNRLAPPGGVGVRPGTLARRVCARFRPGDNGNALVEFALVLPVLMMCLTGVLSFGLSMVNYEALNHGVALGADYLVANRLQTTDPCIDVWNKLTAAAPTLVINANNAIYITLTPQGGTAVTSDATGSCKGSQTILQQGSNITVSATYPCGWGAFGWNFASGCVLTGTVTEYEF